MDRRDDNDHYHSKNKSKNKGSDKGNSNSNSSGGQGPSLALRDRGPATTLAPWHVPQVTADNTPYRITTLSQHHHIVTTPYHNISPHNAILAPTPCYIPQLQLHILCAGPSCTGAVLVSQSATKGATLFRVARDDEFILQMLTWIRRFYVTFVLARKLGPDDALLPISLTPPPPPSSSSSSSSSSSLPLPPLRPSPPPEGFFHAGAKQADGYVAFLNSVRAIARLPQP